MRLSLGLLVLLIGCGPSWRPIQQSQRLSSEQQRGLLEQARRQFLAPRTRRRVEQSLSSYRHLISAAPRNRTYLVEAARVAAWLARRQTSAQTAQLGVEYAGAAIALSERDAEAHLQRAICLGLYARSNQAESLALIKQMARHAQRVVTLDPALAQAGGHRYLCRLLAQAPEFPVSIGDSEAAVEHGLEAIEIAPHHPENQLALAAAYLDDQQPEQARRHARLTLLLLDREEWEDAQSWRREAKAILATED